MYVVTPKEMAFIDKITIEDVGIPGMVLMENAGRGAFEFFREILPDFLDRKIGIVCGTGNNGGDGFVIARLCHGAGADVRVFCAKDPGRLDGDAKRNFEVISRLDIPVYVFDEKGNQDVWDIFRESTAVVDALFGTGLNRNVDGIYKKIIDEINNLGVPVLAVDIPSGINGATGHVMGVATCAYGTATFGLPKVGHYLWPGVRYTGKLKVVDIGIPPSVVAGQGIARFLLTREYLSFLLTPRVPIVHKGNAGHFAVLACSPGKTGAGAMTAVAGIRGGAGLVTLMVPESLNPILEEKTTESMTLPLKETLAHTVSLEAEDDILDFISDKQCFAIGPGLSTHAETKELVRRIVGKSSVPMVIDADGLNAIADSLEVLENAGAPIVLTPHPGEMSRLAGTSVTDVQANRIEVAQEFSRRYGVVVVLKGFHTIVASPDGRVAINTTGNPAMASGGMGDVLTGLIGAFICQGLSPFDAACVGVYVHGKAADDVVSSRKWGTRGLIATDLLEKVPEIIREIEET